MRLFGGTEIDSRDGVSKGALFEVGAGQGVVGGGGFIATTDSKGNTSGSGLAYLGGGVHAGAGAASFGLVGFSSGVGLFGDGFLFGRGGGAGLYVNISSNYACESGKR